MRKRVGIRSSLASGKVGTALWLGMVLIAMVIFGSDVASRQAGARTVAQPPLFNAIDLNPSGFDESHASGIFAGEQAGYGSGPATEGQTHALLWHGSSASVVDLHPSGVRAKNAPWAGPFTSSLATGICGGQQVGYGNLGGYYDPRALLWRGTPGSVVDLHPSVPVRVEGLGEVGITDSLVLGTSGGQQVGYGRENATSGTRPVPLLWRGTSADVTALPPPSGFWGQSYPVGTSGAEQVGYGYYGPGQTHALLWHRTSASAVDLTPERFFSSRALATAGGQEVGYGSGPGTGSQDHALVWRGSAASVVDLHPSGLFFSRALGTNGEEQVGWGDQHALLWRGTAPSVVDLHTFLPPGFVISLASDVDTGGDIVGTAWGPASGNRYHAFLWKRNASKPAASGGQNSARCQNQS